MNKLIVLEFVDKKPCLQNYETHTLMKIKRSKRALKKLRKIDCENIALSKNALAIMPYEHCIEEVKSVSEACALSVIGKICREVSSKYGYKLPLEDVYIYASPSKAYSYIEKLVEISRIFTIITSEPAREEAYNLYARYGCLIRHIRSEETLPQKEALSILIDNSHSLPFSIPAINLSAEIITGKNVTDIREISVVNDRIRKLEEDMSVVGGLILHTLLGIIPEENSLIDINKSADAIFMLDTKGF